MSNESARAVAWEAYDNAVRAKAGPPTVESATFEARGLYCGQLPEDQTAQVLESLSACTIIPFRIADFTPGYVTARFPQSVADGLNASSRFRNINTKTSWNISNVLDEIKDEVAACLGTPWKVLNIRSWSTLPQSEIMGPYAWHSDGFVDEIFKVMLYLTPLSEETGGIEFEIDGQVVKHRSDRAGAWALFKNTKIKHRGVAGTISERLAVEITLCRSIRYDLRPRYPGLNAHWPEFPWIDALDGCTAEASQEADGHKESVEIRQVSPFARILTRLRKSYRKRKQKLFGRS